MKTFSRMILASAVLALTVGQASATNNPWISLGNDTLGPQIQITINADNSITVGPGPGFAQGPYDGIEDTYFGVLNNSSQNLLSLHLTGSFIFGFDGDGEAAYTGISYGPSGYEGPETSFTVNNVNDGDVNFLNGGVSSGGGEAWFTLEENAAASGTNFQVTTGVPEPASVVMLGMGVLSLAGYRRRMRKQAA